MTEPLATCIFSNDRTHRYSWSRQLSDNSGLALFIALNPSKADEWRSDNTVTRMCGYAGRWGYGAMEVGNLNAFRATDPAIMKAAIDPVGYYNDHYLREAIQRCDLVLVCWGIHGAFMDRDQEVLEIIRQEGQKPYCLGKTKQGFPRHLSRLANGVARSSF